jgi:[histone H3]-lysine36 N-dimethyltransferase SETMAR
MIYEFHSKKNAIQATNSICSVHNDHAHDVGTCQRWFARFSSGDFDLNDKDRPGRPIEASFLF